MRESTPQDDNHDEKQRQQRRHENLTVRICIGLIGVMFIAMVAAAFLAPRGC